MGVDAVYHNPRPLESREAQAGEAERARPEREHSLMHRRGFLQALGLTPYVGLGGSATGLPVADPADRRVLDKDLRTPPPSARAGDSYIVAARASGGWAGHAGDVATFDGGGWEFQSPRQGWRVWVVDERTSYFHTGRDWRRLNLSDIDAGGFFFLDEETDPDKRSVRLQAAIDAIEEVGGGTIWLPPGELMLGASRLDGGLVTDGGVEWPCSTCCLVLRPTVTLRGMGRALTRLRSIATGELSVIYAASPNGNGVFDMEIDGQWDGKSGAGHGIAQLLSSPKEAWCRRFTLERLHIRDCASYGVGLQSGDIEATTLRSLHIQNVGADGIDSKQTGPAGENEGLVLDGILVEHFGRRLDGQAGIDCHGRCTASNIHIKDMGRTGVSQTGFRFRTLSESAEGENARGSSLTNFIVECGRDGANTGVFTGSRDTHIAQGYVSNPAYGIVVAGNKVGAADRTAVATTSVAGATTQGFLATSGVEGTRFIGCQAVDCAVGFRNEASGTVFDACGAPGSVQPKSTSTAAFRSEIVTGQALDAGAPGLSLSASAPGCVELSAKGPSEDLDVWLAPGGKGLLRYGEHAPLSGETVSGYVTIRDASGQVRKIAIVS